MTYELLTFEVADRIATITVNRPEKLNALNDALMAELSLAIDEAGRRGDVGAVLLTGAGRAFVAGADIGELVDQSATEGKARAERGQRAFRKFERSPKPTLAAVNGFALGGGCELAMACHVRIASEAAKFGQPEVKLGIVPGYGASQRLPRLVGKGRALQLLLTGEMIDAAEAYRIGLVNRVVPPAELLAAARAMLATILAQGPLAVAQCIEAVDRGLDLPLDDGIALEASYFGLLSATADKAEGMQAFLEKRPAQFQGKYERPARDRGTVVMRDVSRVLLTTLALRDFRNLLRVDVVVPSEGVVVIGENGQGKTNLLEAIYYLHLLRSVRGARDVDVVRFGAPGFHIAARTGGGPYHELSAGFERQGRRKRVKVDGAEPARLSDALGALPCVLFSPADVDLVAGAPTSRRRYLDILLALSSRPYLAALQRYRAALAQRNAALRDAMRNAGGRAEQRVAVWEAPLAEHGAVLWRERVAWAGQSAGRFAELCASIGEQAPVAMRYATSLEPAAESVDAVARALAEALEHKRPLDMRRGLTHAGPHRDDLVLTLDARELRAFGSAGQQRTAAIALRLLEAETLRSRLGAAPLFLLDDPFAELDVRRSTNILELLAEQGMGQTLLTVPRESDIPPALTTLRRWRIAGGVVSGDDVQHAGAA